MWVWVGVGVRVGVGVGGCDFFPSRPPAPSLHASGRRGSPLGMGGAGAPHQPRGPRRTRPPVSRSRGLVAWDRVSGLPGALPGLRMCAKTQIRRLLHPLPARPALRGSRLGSQGGPDVGCKGEEMEGGNLQESEDSAPRFSIDTAPQTPCATSGRLQLAAPHPHTSCALGRRPQETSVLTPVAGSCSAGSGPCLGPAAPGVCWLAPGGLLPARLPVGSDPKVGRQRWRRDTPRTPHRWWGLRGPPSSLCELCCSRTRGVWRADCSVPPMAGQLLKCGPPALLRVCT